MACRNGGKLTVDLLLKVVSEDRQAGSIQSATDILDKGMVLALGSMQQHQVCQNTSVFFSQWHTI